MSISNMTASNITEKINDDYEFIQYNEKMRLIHSVKDDMYQMQSIIKSCNSKKQATRWMNRQETNEIIKELALAQKCTGGDLIVDRPNLPNELRGMYIHRLLVNDVACWANRKYAIYIPKRLDDYFEKQRNEMQQKIIDQKPRLVPESKEKSYKYMIWKEEIAEQPNEILLHLVRRNNRSFSQVINIKNDSNKCWFYRENLPIAMTPNEDVKKLVKTLLPGSDYTINACTIKTYKHHLQLLHEKITEYFNKFQI